MKLIIDIDEDYYKIICKRVEENRTYPTPYEYEVIANGKTLEQEPTTKNDLAVDIVSRKAVHDMLENLSITVEDKWFNWLQKACMRLAELPSVTPQEPKKRHWIRISPAEIYECSECGQNVMTSDICVYKFCHGCGARMVELQESEE